MIWLVGYSAFTAVCATILYTSWRKRLGIHDPWNAIQLGFYWPVMFAIILYSRLSGKRIW